MQLYKSSMQAVALTSMQAMLMPANLKNIASSDYNVGGYALLENNIDVSLLKRAFEILYKNHDALQMRLIATSTNKAMQYVSSGRIRNIDFLDYSQDSNSLERAIAWMQSNFNKALNPFQEAPFQLCLLKLATNKYFLYAKMHHVFSDGLSVFLLYDKLVRIYEQISFGQSLRWLYNASNFCCISNNEKQYLSSARYCRDRLFWQNYSKSSVVSKLVKRYPGTSGASIENFDLPHHTQQLLLKYSASHKQSIMSIFASLIAFYFSGQLSSQSVTMGFAVHGRSNNKSKEDMGKFSNRVALIAQLETSKSFVENTASLAAQIWQVNKHSRLPVRKYHRSYLDNLDINITYESYPEISNSKLKVENFTYMSASIQAQPIILRLIAQGGGLSFKVSYQKCYFNRADIYNIYNEFIRLSELLLVNCNVNVHRITTINKPFKDNSKHR